MTSVPGRLVAALADRYRLERELGQGGMATVYLAHSPATAAASRRRPATWMARLPGRGVIYLRGAPERPASYLRVVPHWVDRMKRAVDEANR